MAATLTLRDETLTGTPDAAWSLEFLTDRITVADLIRERVYQEVADANVAARIAGGTHRRLVTPTETERQLNAPGPSRPARTIDWKRQVAVAEEAFTSGRFLILVDGRQVDSLTDPITVGPDTDVAFVRLTMLVGG